MASPSDSSVDGETTNWKASLTAFVIATLGFIGAGLSTKITTPWIQNTVVALMTTIISTALLQLIFELILRRNVYREMFKLAGISRNLASQQFKSAGKLRSLDWSEVYTSKSEIFFLLTDLQPWVDQHINSLLENGRNRPINITFFVCDTNAAYSAQVADSLSMDANSYLVAVKHAIERIERTWKALKSSGNLVKASTISIRLLDNRPLYSLVTCDDVTVLVLPAVTGRVGADTEYFYLHSGDRSFYPSSWFREQLSRLEGLPISFEDRIA
ncbi:hypothetical protein [Sphingomonas sp. Leaf339]|uniref:hypothetical protein n=1 Tax=Sphingomonas sp. Leaf339 TaxID=1736343 RepID=UPI000A74CDE0|nr:hypothetical protein [Sphingomonas sp. Leaf339]